MSVGARAGFDVGLARSYDVGRLGGDFDPRSVPGLVVWLDARSYVLNPGIERLPDQSGLGNDAVQLGKPQQLVNNALTQNGLKVIQNDHVDDYMTLTTPLVLANWDIFVLGRTVDGQASAGVWLGAAPAGNVQMLCINSTANTITLYDGSQGSHSAALAVDPGINYSVLECARSAGTTFFYQNGINYATAIDFGSPAANVALAQLLRNDTTVSFPCDTLELLIYDRLLTDAQRGYIVGGLRELGGIS